MEPNLLARAIRTTARIRACRFSSVVSRGSPAKTSARIPSNASIAGAIGRQHVRMPRFSATSRASSMLSGEV